MNPDGRNRREAPSLARFQDAFARALLDRVGTPAAEVAELCAQPGFAVYRNTVMTGAIDALAANFPAVARLTGDEWFRAAAAVYARSNPPRDPALILYGATFPAFLDEFEPAAELPYLPAVARLDRCWCESHTAPTQPALAPAVVAALAPDVLGRTILVPHPAARWAWFAQVPAWSIWSRNRTGEDLDAPLDWHGEGALLTRPTDGVKWFAIGAGACALLDACAAGAALGEAAAMALAEEPEADLAHVLSDLLAAGAFCQARRADETTPKEQ